MKYVIEGPVEKLDSKTILITQIDIDKVIVVAKKTIYGNRIIYILTQTPENKWYLAELTARNRTSTHCEASPYNVLRLNTYDSIYQFETIEEFIIWLAKEFHIKGSDL